jgi:hypothetical protein
MSTGYGHLVPMFTNVNEEGDTYPRDAHHDNLEDAMRYLREYPNDRIEVTLEFPDRRDQFIGQQAKGTIPTYVPFLMIPS